MRHCDCACCSEVDSKDCKCGVAIAWKKDCVLMPATMGPRRIVIMGAAGRDFHNFNVVYRDDPAAMVVAFTAAQIPGIADRRYPASLAGPRYPDGIPILDERDLAEICRREAIDEVVFAYSDVEHAHVMHKASIALAAGADFTLLGPKRTMLEARVPVIASLRRAHGRGQVADRTLALGAAQGARPSRRRAPPSDALWQPRASGGAALRKPWPISTQPSAPSRSARSTSRTSRSATWSLPASTMPASSMAAEKEADIIVWDGGNNDFPFVRPSLHIVLVDPLRPGHETTHHPGEAVLRMADVVIVAKTNSASDGGHPACHRDRASLSRPRPRSRAAHRSSPWMHPTAVARQAGPRRRRRADAHARRHGLRRGLSCGRRGQRRRDRRSQSIGGRAYRGSVRANTLISARCCRPWAIRQDQLAELRATINRSDADVVVIGSPSDIARLMTIDKAGCSCPLRVRRGGHIQPRLGALMHFSKREEGGNPSPAQAAVKSPDPGDLPCRSISKAGAY